MKHIVVGFCLLFTVKSFTQDSLFARKIVDTLTSKTFWGRGYTNDGMHKAAAFLANEFKDFGLEPMKGKSFFQEYSFSVNTFPDKMNVIINDKELVDRKDFIVAAESKGLIGEGELEQIDSIQFIDKKTG